MNPVYMDYLTYLLVVKKRNSKSKLFTVNSLEGMIFLRFFMR